MKGLKFYIRIINILAILLIIYHYNHTISTYALEEKDEQQIDSIQQESIYQDGIYQGDAQGYGGIVKVEVVILDGAITQINVLSAEKEDEAYYDMAVEIIDTMIARQSTQVDTVSGATYTSTGIKNAVIEALKQAVK